MASRIFGSSSIGVKHFEIRLQQSLLVFHGSDEEASGVHLQGTLVLCLAEPLKVQRVRLRLTGERRVSWGNDGPQQRKDNLFYRIPWEFVGGPRRGETLAAGNYEWPFDHLIPGHMPESVEGRWDSYLIYRMKATIERGFLSHSVVARKHVRIIRTLNAAAEELSHEVAIGGNWEDKINYRVSTPTNGVVFGTTVPVKFRIAPLLKGLRIGEIHLTLCEDEQVYIGPQGEMRAPRSYKPVKGEYTFPQGQATEVVDGLDCWMFTLRINLPKTLRECRQSVTADCFHIEHSLKITVKLVNPGGHISELRGHIPLFIYISPFLPIDENNEMILPVSGAIDPNVFAVGAPPVYGEHRYDILFSGVESSGYITPAGGLSGTNTPLNSPSPRGSADNLASLSTMTSPFTNLSALQGRLCNLDNTRVGQDAPATTLSSEELHVQQDREAEGQTSLSRDGPGNRTPQVQHYEYSPEELARIPSYNTALRSPLRTPIHEISPSYGSTISGSMSQPPVSTPLHDTRNDPETRGCPQH